MAELRCSPWMLVRARQATPGVCLICGPDTKATGVTWAAGSGERLCTGHAALELVQAHAALAAADEDRAAPRRHRRTTRSTTITKGA